MGIPARQAARVGAYVLKHRLRRTARFPLVLMLEPLFRCNLRCAGCGKTRHPEAILKKRLTPEECFEAADACGAPVVSVAGGEPLLHNGIGRIVEGLVDRRKFVYLCTNALLLEKRLHWFHPSPYLIFSVHLDGMREQHDRSVRLPGVFDKTVRAVRLAKARGFRVMTNTTIFNDADPTELRRMFDFLEEIGIDGMMISPGYAYEKASARDHFLEREETVALFREILQGRNGWTFNHSPQFLEFLEGRREYDCSPWGNPTRTVLGWQRPCYLLEEGHAETYRDLIEGTEWEAYGRKSGNPKCRNCMVHSGFEATAVLDAVSSPGEALRSALAFLRASRPDRPPSPGRGAARRPPPLAALPRRNRGGELD